MNDLLSDRYKKQNEVSMPDGSPKRYKRASEFECFIPTLKFSNFAGVESIIAELDRYVIRIFKNADIYRSLKIAPTNGIILHGPSGCGKSKLAEALSGELGVNFFYVSSPEIVSGMSGESEQKIRELFKAAKEKSPSIILFDEIDAIAVKREFSNREMERRIVTQLLTCMDRLNENFLNGECLTLIVATTSQPDALDPGLRRAGRFDYELKVPIPSESTRAEILKLTASQYLIDDTVNFDQIAKSCPGFVPADLLSLFRAASNIALDRYFQFQDDFAMDHKSNFSVSLTDFTKALTYIQPSAVREGFGTIPDVSWDDIGALELVREELRLSIVEPIKNRLVFESFGLSSPCGILLWGPPGCGKTLLAKAIANESHSNFISVKGPELINKYVGESERAIRSLFNRARASSPCIIFFDEIDSICPQRSDSSEGSSSRVVNQLLTEMDGIEGRKDVYIIAATNRPDMIDPAIIRPGRLDKLVYITLPSAEERYSILRAQSRKMPLDLSLDLREIAFDPRCQRFSGADISSLMRESALLAIKDYLIDPKLNEERIIFKKYIDMAFSKVSPSVSEAELSRFEHMLIKFSNKN